MMPPDVDSPSAAHRERPTLIYLVTEDWYFWSHRLPMARAARAAGFDVAVACRVRSHGERIREEGFTLHPLSWNRGDLGPIRTLRDVLEIARLYRRRRPAIVHHVAMRPVVLGSLAAAAAGVPCVVNALTGLGFLFTSPSLKARLLRLPVALALRLLLNRRRSRVVLQNSDDRAYLERIGLIAPEKAVTIRGSGIEVERFRPLPEPADGVVTVAYVGRMIEDKGVRTLVEAVRRVRARGIALRLVLAGSPDYDNPGSLTEAELRRWADDPMIEWVGHIEDVRSVWARSHVAALSSRREGLPKSLLEAAACGRPIVATNVPGCREIARRGENAILVPPDDPDALGEALVTLARDAELRRRYGMASRRIVLSDLSADRVGAAIVAVYKDLLDGT
jgi:glycosyltransferase involved in cell wall biosynthesis